MHQFDVAEAPAAGGLEELLEVAALPMVDDVQDPVGPPVLQPPANRGQIGRGVEKGPVGLADQQRRLLLAVEKDPDRPAALAGQPGGQQVVDHPGEQGLEEALAELVVEGDVEPPVEPLDLGQADRHELLPEAAVLGIARMEPGGLGQHLAARLGVGRRQGGRLGIGGESSGLASATLRTSR